MIKIKVATSVDAYLVGTNLRKEDERELTRSGQMDHLKVVMDSFRASTLCWVGYSEEGVVAIGGVTALDIPDVGAPWMLSTPLLHKHFTKLLRVTKPYVAKMNEAYPILYNMTDVHNTKAIAWLQWAGFSLGDPFKLPTGFYFITFTKERKNV